MEKTTTEETKNQIVVVDPKELGLDETKAKEVESVFTPLIIEREALTVIYQQLITEEMSKELVNKAYQLRLKLTKVRTGTDKVHKVAKAFYLAGGRFVDAWKNKNNIAIEQMESKLEEIENYYENLEKERIAKLQTEREKELAKYDVENIQTLSLGNMSEQVWENFLTGTKLGYENRKAAELKAEQDRIEAERKEAEEREAQRLENIRLKKEAELKEKQLEIERAKADAELKAIKEKAEADRKAAEEAAKKLKEETEKQVAEERARVNAEQETMRKEAREKIEAERKEREKAEAELKAAKDAEAKRIADEEAAKEAELGKGDEAKTIDLTNKLIHLKTAYVFKSAKNAKMYAEVGLLIDKIINHIKK